MKEKKIEEGIEASPNERQNQLNPFSAGTVFIRQNPISVVVISDL